MQRDDFTQIIRKIRPDCEALSSPGKRNNWNFFKRKSLRTNFFKNIELQWLENTRKENIPYIKTPNSTKYAFIGAARDVVVDNYVRWESDSRGRWTPHISDPVHSCPITYERLSFEPYLESLHYNLRHFFVFFHLYWHTVWSVRICKVTRVAFGNEIWQDKKDFNIETAAVSVLDFVQRCAT